MNTKVFKNLGVSVWLGWLGPSLALGGSTYDPYTFTTIAGKPGVAGSADGTNEVARFNSPLGVAVDRRGTVYVTDWKNATIRKVTAVGTNWIVTTLAGQAGLTGSADGIGSAARFSSPFGIAADSGGNVYVTDWTSISFH